MLINNATYQRQTLSERPIRQPLKENYVMISLAFGKKVFYFLWQFSIRDNDDELWGASIAQKYLKQASMLF